MYHLPEPQVIYNRKFVEKFVKENKNPANCTCAWSNNEEKIKKDKNGMYTTGSLWSPYCFATDMLCRLFGKPYTKKFSSEWLPLVAAVINATIINWAQILSNNLAIAVLEYRRKRSIDLRVYPPFL